MVKIIRWNWLQLGIAMAPAFQINPQIFRQAPRFCSICN